MDRLIYYNDRVVEAETAGVEVNNAGLLYGWGVFATLRIIAGEAFAFERYWQRLLKHAERAQIATKVNAEQSAFAMNELITANGVIDGRARITLLKSKASGWRKDLGRETDLLIFTATERKQSPRDAALTISPYRILSSSPLAGIKRTAMLEHLLAMEEARLRKFDEAVLLNERGEMVSATAGNLFWSDGNEVFTPSLATGCVAGVMRAFTCEILQRCKLNLIEGSFPVQRLLGAAEVFLTSTARGITRVSRYDIKEYDAKASGIHRLIRREMTKLVRQTLQSK